MSSSAWPATSWYDTLLEACLTTWLPRYTTIWRPDLQSRDAQLTIDSHREHRWKFRISLALFENVESKWDIAGRSLSGIAGPIRTVWRGI